MYTEREGKMDETPGNVTGSGFGKAEDEILACMARCQPGSPSSVQMTGFPHSVVRTAVADMQTIADSWNIELTANYSTANAIVSAKAKN